MSATSVKPLLPQQARGDRRPVAAGAVDDGRAFAASSSPSRAASWPTGIAIAPGIVPAGDLAGVADVDDLQVGHLATARSSNAVAVSREATARRRGGTNIALTASAR